MLQNQMKEGVKCHFLKINQKEKKACVARVSNQRPLGLDASA